MIATLMRHSPVAVLIVLTALVLAACGSKGELHPLEPEPTSVPPETPGEEASPTAEPATPPPSEEQPASFELAQSATPRDTAPVVDAADLAGLSAGNAAFAFDLYQAIRQEGDNLIYSPFSVSLALAMVYAGARGDTEQQMADTLHFVLPQDRLHPAFNALDLLLSRLDQSGGEGSFRLNIANAIWGQTGFPFYPEYLDVIARNYGAGLRLLDFVAAPEPSRLAINDWVADETEQRIRDLLPPGSINPATRLVLTNAIYFYGAWMSPFDANVTRDESFYLLDGGTVAVPMMTQSAHFRYGLGDEYTAVELPYEGGQTAMLIVMPDEGRFADFEATLSADRIAALQATLNSGQVNLTMPRFEYTTDFSLNDALIALGMTDAFSPQAADFSGIAPVTVDQNLYITDVVHKAFVKVDESGTEAAAATGVVVGITSIAAEPVTIRIDHPFIFLIYEQQTGTILFVGRVLNPAS